MTQAALPHLSPRENQVCGLVAKGKTNLAIASALKLSEGTVRTYLDRIFQKFGCHSRTELAVQYVQGAPVKPARAKSSTPNTSARRATKA
jgi:DNA-binding NarL/FixJ family response regulator